jgi:hypothetical protein
MILGGKREVIFVRYNFRRRKRRMWLANPNTISVIGDFETMYSKSGNNCPLLFYVIQILTLYIHSTFCVTF